MNEQLQALDVAGILIPAWVNGELRPYDKLAAHTEGLRHQAISVFIMCGDSILIQRRALHKYHTPGLWANTCCTHPAWGEDMATCAHRRLDEELGLRDVTLTHRGSVEYRADVGGGLIEHEAVEVFVGQVAQSHPFTPNPDEVMETNWIDYSLLSALVDSSPEKFTPWLRIYLEKHHNLIFG